jgi:hypothetical protein
VAVWTSQSGKLTVIDGIHRVGVVLRFYISVIQGNCKQKRELFASFGVSIMDEKAKVSTKDLYLVVAAIGRSN